MVYTRFRYAKRFLSLHLRMDTFGMHIKKFTKESTDEWIGTAATITTDVNTSDRCWDFIFLFFSLSLHFCVYFFLLVMNSMSLIVIFIRSTHSLL